MPTGPEESFGNTGRVWATALRPDPPLKRSCAVLARLLGCATNTVNVQNRTSCTCTSSDSTCRVDVTPDVLPTLQSDLNQLCWPPANPTEISFSSPRLIALKRLKNSVCRTIYLKRDGEYIDSCLTQDIRVKWITYSFI